MSNRRKVFQFRVSLEEIEPEIWRRIQIPSNSTFWELHCAIQDSFGWQDCHLHEFRGGTPFAGLAGRAPRCLHLRRAGDGTRPAS